MGMLGPETLFPSISEKIFTAEKSVLPSFLSCSVVARKSYASKCECLVHLYKGRGECNQCSFFVLKERGNSLMKSFLQFSNGANLGLPNQIFSLLEEKQSPSQAG